MDDENNTPVIGVAPSLEELVAFYDEAEGFPVIVAQEESAAVAGEKLLLDHHAIDAIAFAASTDALLENLEIMDGGDHGERTQHGDSSASPDRVSFRANSSSLLQPKSDDDDQEQQQQRVPPAQQSQNRSERVAAQHGPKYRNRHKEELEYLRVQVSELEAQLQQLQQRSIVEHDAHAPPSSKLDDGQQERDRIRTVAPVSTAPFWKRIALHQQEATLKAEHENAQLRQTIQEQLKISKMLERILAKRHRMSSVGVSLFLCLRIILKANPAFLLHLSLDINASTYWNCCCSLSMPCECTKIENVFACEARTSPVFSKHCSRASMSDMWCWNTRIVQMPTAS